MKLKFSSIFIFWLPKIIENTKARSPSLGRDPSAERKGVLTCTPLFALTKLGLTKNPRPTKFQSGVTQWPKIFFEKTITRKD